MRGFSSALAVALVATAFAAQATAAGFLGGGPPGGGWTPGGAGPVLPLPGGPGGPPQRGPSGPKPSGPGPNVFTPHSPAGPNGAFTPPHPGWTPQPGVAGRGPGLGQDWRKRPRHYWPGGGPIFVPQPSGDYLYSDEDYDDGGDPSGCWVFRKAYDRAGHFLGWVHVDLCEGQ